MLQSLESQMVALLGAVALLGGAGGLAGCGSIEPVAPYDQPITDPTQLYTRLTIDHPAVNMSTAPGYNTLQLTATPRDAEGNPMPGLPVPTFRSADTTKVRVTADGLLTAVGVVNDFSIIASLQVGPVTHADTALVNVNNQGAPPKLATLSIHPVPPDSAVWGMIHPGQFSFASTVTAALGGGPSFSPKPVLRVVDSTGNAMTGLQVEYTSLDPAIARTVPSPNALNAGRRTGFLELIRPGQVRVVARTMAYGIAMADTVTYTITPPPLGDVSVTLGDDGAPIFSPEEIRIAPFGIVVWTNYLGDSVDVTFDGSDPTYGDPPPESLCDLFASLAFYFGPGPFCGTGDVLMPPMGEPRPDLALDGAEVTTQLRQFPMPGIYTYHSTRTGASGRIEVTLHYDD